MNFFHLLLYQFLHWFFTSELQIHFKIIIIFSVGVDMLFWFLNDQRLYLLNVLLIVWRNFSILGPKLALAYAEDILSDSRLKNCAKCKSRWCKSAGVERFEIWGKMYFGKNVHLACYKGITE